MEIYILDSLLRRDQVVDRFESMIWTERYAEIGDFELSIHSTREARGQFRAGTLLAINSSYRVMEVNSVENLTTTEGKSILKVKGSSLESLLEDRVAKASHANLTLEPEWVITDTPGNIARKIFNDICRLGTLSPADIIPYIMPGTILPVSTIPETSTTIQVKLAPQTVKEAIQNLCVAYDLGYRLVRNFDASQLYFDIYSGDDRTTRQIINEPVIFAVEQDNMKNITELTNSKETKNVAYVYSEYGSLIVYPDDIDPSIDGFDRRVLVLNVNVEEGEDANAIMEQRGKEALYATRVFTGLDGEINQYSPYKYGTHYNLGDLVETRNLDGEIRYKRVTEQIFISDTEGERSYPTLTMNQILNENTWLIQKSDKFWADFGPTEYWADQ